MPQLLKVLRISGGRDTLRIVEHFRRGDRGMLRTERQGEEVQNIIFWACIAMQSTPTETEIICTWPTQNWPC